MSKQTYTFCVDRYDLKKGMQSQHVGSVAVIIGTVAATGAPYYRLGVAIKHPRDKAPFNKREGRDIATLRAGQSAPIFSIQNLVDEAHDAICKGVREWKVLQDTNVDKTLERIEHVMKTVAGYDRGC